MKSQVKKILQELKDKKIPVSKIEKDLNIPSGLLWKVKEGLKTINQERMDQLIEYHRKNTGVKIVNEKIKSTPVIKQIAVIKNNLDKKVMPKGLSAIEQIDWRIKNG